MPASCPSFDDRERPSDADPLEARIREYWDWWGVALFLLLAVDVLTTAFAARAVGVGAEANPLTRWLLVQGPIALAAANVAAVVLAAVLFRAVVAMLRIAPDPVQGPYARVIEVWIGALVAVGLFVFANNLSVVVLGASLL